MKVNQLYNGDSIQLIKKIDNDSVHLILSDIPYGIGYEDWDVLHNNTNSAFLGSSKAQEKAGGLAGYNKETNIKNYFKKVDEALKQSSDKIKFLYISLNDSSEKTKRIKEVIDNDYKGKFFYYFVTADSWHYSEWNDNNLLPSKRDDGDRKLKEVLEDIIDR